MNKTLLGYLKTFTLTALTTFFAAIGLFAWLINSVSSENAIRQSQQDNQIDFELIQNLIFKNEKMTDLHPENFKYDLKLGFLYEIKADYKNAEYYYKRAIEKAPYNEFKPKYDLAKLYIVMDKLDDAAKIMNDISEKPNRKLIKYKGDIFFGLGDAYFYKGDYSLAYTSFIKSKQYHKLLKDREILTELNNNLASCLVYIVQDEIDTFKYDDAINHFHEALNYVNAPIIKYNLALLYIYKEPLLAVKYFEEVFEKEPKIINFDTYYSLLSSLADEADEMGETVLAKLYRYKIQKVKNFYTTNMLTTKDLVIKNNKGKIIYNKFLKKYKVAFTFRFKNTSIYDINSLFVNVIVKNNDREIYNSVFEPVNEKEKLKPANFTNFIEVETKTLKYKKQIPKKITVEIYASKKPNNKKLLVQTFSIEPEISKSFIQKVLHKFGSHLVK